MGLASSWIPAALQRTRKEIYVHKTSTPSPWVPTTLQKESMWIELASPWVPPALQREKGEGGVHGTRIPFLPGHCYRTATWKEGSVGLATSWVPSALQKKRCVCVCGGGNGIPFSSGPQCAAGGKKGSASPFLRDPHTARRTGGRVRPFPRVPSALWGEAGRVPGIRIPSPWVPNGKGGETHGTSIPFCCLPEHR